jgi:hypothetical protein
MAASAPPIDVGEYHRLKLAMGKDATVEQIANKLGISFGEAQAFENQLAELISDEMRNRNRIYDVNKSLGMGGRKRRGSKSKRRGSKKSRRHGKKSRRHAKKSRRHGKKCRR